MFRNLWTILFLFAAARELPAQLLYVTNAGDNTISSFVIDEESGLLTEIVPSVAASGPPTSLAIHPSGRYLFTTNSGNAATGAPPAVAQYSIDQKPEH